MEHLSIQFINACYMRCKDKDRHAEKVMVSPDRYRQMKDLLGVERYGETMFIISAQVFADATMDDDHIRFVTASMPDSVIGNRIFPIVYGDIKTEEMLDGADIDAINSDSLGCHQYGMELLSKLNKSIDSGKRELERKISVKSILDRILQTAPL